MESIVTQLMEKQRCARAAALSGKSLDCPSCGDPNQECNLHHVTGTTVQSTTGGGGSGRRVQATKSEAHTTTSGRSSGHNRSTHKRMLQHRIHENNNQVITIRYTYTLCSVFRMFFSFSPQVKTHNAFFFLFSILISDEIQFSTFAVLQGQRSIQSSGFLLSSIFNNWRSSRSSPSTATSRTATTTSNGPFKTSSSESGRKKSYSKRRKKMSKKSFKKNSLTNSLSYGH